MNTRLVLLIVSLPPNPSSLRVRVWRRLRAIGAVALKRTVYLLPDTPDHYEHFQWLAQEIQRAGGEATLLRVEQIENMSSGEIVELFHEARNPEYRQLGGRYRKLLQTLDRKSAATNPRVQAELAQLQRDYEKLHELDFFEAPEGAEVERLREAIDMRTRPSEEPKRREKSAPELRDLQGRQWVTRRRPHVDRIASAWLIKRFIDPDATFVFADPRAFPKEAIPFDTPGADLSHVRDDCTFETLLKRTGLRDRRLTRLAEIVHEADLRDGKFPRDEARGIDLAIRGFLAATFQRNIDWVSTQARYEDASKVEGPRPLVQKEFGDLPGVGVEEVKAMLDSGTPVQIIDARPRSYISRQQDIMDGAVWRDPERIKDWIGQLSKSDPVVVFCAYGFHVGCKTAIALREAGFDAKYMKGGHSAWKAIGGPLKLYA